MSDSARTADSKKQLSLFDAGFCDSAGESWLPHTFRRAPVDALDQHRKLRRRQQGANKFRILSAPIMGWEYWTESKKPVRTKERWTRLTRISAARMVGIQSAGRIPAHAANAGKQSLWLLKPAVGSVPG
jgi:hypothetical protein